MIFGKTIIKISKILVIVIFSVVLVNSSQAAGVANIVTSTTGSSGQIATFNALSSLFTNACVPARVFDPICGFLSGGLGIGRLAVDGLAMQQLSTQADIQVNTMQRSATGSVVRAGIERLALRRLAMNNQEPLRLAVSDTSEFLAGTGDVSLIRGPFGLFLSSKGNWGDTDTNDGETGFKHAVYEVTTGMDYRFSADTIGGLLLNYINGNDNFTLDSGSLETDIYRIALFGSIVPVRNAYIDGIIGAGWLDFDIDRGCFPCGSNGVKLSDKAGFEGDQYFASLGAGYTHKMGAWGIKGYTRADYTYLNTDGYSLNYGFSIPAGNGTLTNSVQGQDVKSLTSTLGTEISRVFKTGFGVVIPRLRGEWVHEYKNSSRSVNTSFSGEFVVPFPVTSVSSNVQTMKTASPERNWFNVGMLVQLLFPHSISGFIGYEALLMEDTSNHSVSAGFRYEF